MDSNKMDKIKRVVWILGGMILTYIILTAVMPLIRDTSSYAANLTDNTTYPEAHAAAASAPYWLYFIPDRWCGLCVKVGLKSSPA